VESAGAVDAMNARFYGKYPFPWRPARFDYVVDPAFETIMLNQGIGDFTHSIIPRRAKIWVAGCGTNQAVFTALRFPEATIIATDLSEQSLEIASGTARGLGIKNLQLKRESINGSAYAEEFDYIICTGVIHHNADPQGALKKLAASLSPTGVLELMVYNRYHRIITTAVQKAIRILGGNAITGDMETELNLARKLVEQFPAENLVSMFLQTYRGESESAIADALIQPVEYSYTVESLEELASSCELELVSPCINLSNRIINPFSWNMQFADREFQSVYDSLPDMQRWQVTNLLMLEISPMLWFYVQRKDSGRRVKSEKELCEEFLSTRFVQAVSEQRTYVLNGDENYVLSPSTIRYPPPPPDNLTNIVNSADGISPMKDIFDRLDLDRSFHSVNTCRLKLTTPASPYLKAAGKSDESDLSMNLLTETSRTDDYERMEESNRQKLKAIRRKPVVRQINGIDD
jgi:SAM-dependent methyltransferase